MKISVKIKAWRKEIKSQPLVYLLLALILLLAFFVRVYRVGDLMGFYFDQGRDALVIWRLWHEGRPFLIGPVTGLAGIFLGPLYYYLIAPFYLIGGGNPAYPAVFLAFISALATFMLYYLGWKFHSRVTGIIAATIGALSFYIVLAGRWLSNPTPILLTSMLLLWSMWKVATGKDMRWWMVIAFLIGISLQFESASAVFYLPMILVFAVWQKKKLPNKKILAISIGVFLLTLLPQIAFNFRHENILFNNFKRVFLEEKSFRLSFWEVLNTRMNYFWTVFYSKIFSWWKGYTAVFVIIVTGVLVSRRKKLADNKVLPLFLIFIGVPMLGYLAFQGNRGNVYDYYMTGYYLPMILLFSIGMGELWKEKGGKFIVLIFFALFLSLNGMIVRYYLIAGVDGPTNIKLGNELQAVNWIFEDAKGRGEFNVDVYVPPVIPHAYDYLFLWQATKRCGEDLCEMKLTERVPLLYTLYEVDPPHPWRLDTWLERQAGIGEVKEEASFGGITVQRRTRI